MRVKLTDGPNAGGQQGLVRIPAPVLSGRDGCPVASGRNSGPASDELLEASRNGESGGGPAGAEVGVGLEDAPEVGADRDGLLEQGRVELDADVTVASVETAASDLQAPGDQFFEDALDGGRQVDGAQLVDKPGEVKQGDSCLTELRQALTSPRMSSHLICWFL